MRKPNKESIERFLTECEKSPVELEKLEKLGEGWHGAGYLAEYKVDEINKRTVIRMIRPEGFGHDFASDRASSLLLQDKLSNSIPNHVKSIGVGAVNPDGKISKVSGEDEFMQAVEVAEGKPYSEELEEILRGRRVNEHDFQKAEELTKLLLRIHSKKLQLTEDTKPKADSIFKRVLRDCIGHGQMLMGVFDTYPDVDWINSEEITEIIMLCDQLRHKLNKMNLSKRLCRVHGDFHPGNIWFNKENPLLLDASRFVWGEPGDDVICILINMIWYSIRQTGGFKGDFKEIFSKIWDNYKSEYERMNGHEALVEMRKIIPLFFSFRAAVVAHPIFFPDQDEQTRKKMIRIAKELLEKQEFSTDNIDGVLSA